MATVTKDFRIKSGLVVEGTNATVDGSDIITEDIITGGTQTNIAVTYDAQNKVLNFVAENGVADSTTDDLTEGTSNLYYTDARARGAVSVEANGPLTYNSTTGEFDLFIATSNSGLEVNLADEGLQIDRDTVDTWYDAAGSAAQALIDANAYTDSAIGGLSTTLSVAGDTGTDTVNLQSDTLTFAGGTGIDVAVTDNTVTASIDSTVATLTGLQTLTNKTLGALGSPVKFGYAIDANNFKIESLATPTNAQDAATKAYVDSVAQGLDVKNSVRVASTANVDISTLDKTVPIDGVAIDAGDRVLLKNQTNASENGIYVIGSSAPAVRSEDANSSSEVTTGMFAFVSEGTTNANTGWVLTTNDFITLGTTALEFAQFSGAGTYLAGTNLELTGNEFALADDITLSTVTADLTGNVDGDVTGTVTSGDMVFNSGGILNSTVQVYNATTGTLVGNLSGNVTGNVTGDLTGSVDVNNGTITNLSDPTNAQDAATKNYVDTELDSYLNSTSGSEGTTILYVQDYVATAIETGDATATPTYLAIDYNSVATQVAATVTAGGTGTDVAYAFDGTLFRTAKFLVKIAYGTHTQVSEVLLTLDTSNNVAITEYAMVGTNGSLGDITAEYGVIDVITNGVKLIVSSATSGAEITVMGTLLV